MLVVSVVLLFSLPKLIVGQSCSNGDVRLVGGSGHHEGRVEICRYSGSWSTVCDTNWGSTDAGVVCRQLGFAYEGAIARLNAYFGRGYGSIYYSRFGCGGTETRILNCYYRYSYGYCNHYDDAGVTCRPSTTITSIIEYNITSEVVTDIEAIRLINGEENVNSGRLEVLYNGVWGTICSDFWSYSDAKVACRMLGYDDAACAVNTNLYGAAVTSVPFWMDNVQCSGSEEALDMCSFSGWGIHNCYHYTDDAGVVCANTSQVGVPNTFRLVNSTTSTLTISFTISEMPNIVRGLRYYVLHRPVTRNYYSSAWIYPASDNETDLEILFTLQSLLRDTEYTIKVRVLMQYSPCTSYIYGNYSDPVLFRTNATRRHSVIPTRLVSPYPGVDFLGRVEVFHSGQWGTICDSSFSTPEANVVCYGLNFTEGALCVVSSARYGRGTGRIWLENLDCTSGDEVIEDCSHRGWGVNYYCSHWNDVGVVCRPNALPPVKNLTVAAVAHTSITVRWTQHSFPRGTSTAQFQLRYRAQGSSSSSTTVIYSSTQTHYRLTNLQFNQQYSISIRAQMRFTSCYSYLYGAYSNEVSVTTMETAPTGPPTSFELVVINGTAIEAMWELPALNQRNGFIRGYRLFVQNTGRDIIRNITISSNETLAYVVGGLQRATPYTFSILAYTVADGPRSVHLTAITLLLDPLIVGFGVYGNNVDKALRYTLTYGLEVHCTTRNDSSITTTNWFFANGSKVGLASSSFREGHYGNGTTVLQIGVNRWLSFCDGGNYTCVVNTTSGRTERRSFRLVIGSTPPMPSRPTIVEVKSRSVTIEWSQSVCNGGHSPKAFTIRYRETSAYSSYFYITIQNPSLRRYTITELSFSTSYQFSVRTTTVDSRYSSYSSSATISTLPQAPSAPRDIRVRQVRPLMIEVSWRPPAMPNGILTHYTVYARPVATGRLSHEAMRSRRQTDSSSQIIKKVFPSTITSGNVSLIEYSTTYQFQVSASTNFGQIPNEGDLSSVTANTSIFVPMPGLPTPMNVNTTTVSNSSITLIWEYPPSHFQTIQSFLVTFSGEVEWRSAGGYLIQFEDMGEVSVTDTTVVVAPLIPDTSYQFRLSAITSSGRGGEVASFGRTQTSRDERLAYFQLRLKPVFRCSDFMNPNNNITDRLLKFRHAIIEEVIAQVCSTCGLTTANIRNDEFSCCGGLTNQIIYRAMIIGTAVYSASGLVSLIQSWVASGTASINVLSLRLHLDRDCSTPLDTLNDPDCSSETEITTTTDASMTTTKKVTTSKPEAETKGHSVKPIVAESVGAGEISGLSVGAIIVILLLMLILLITIIALRKFKSNTGISVSYNRMFDASFTNQQLRQTL